jgi:hypothetical protein
VSEKARLDVFEFQGFAEQRIFLQVDLSDSEVIGSLPVPLHAIKHLRR